MSEKLNSVDKALQKAEVGPVVVRSVEASVMSPMQLADVFLQSGFFQDVRDKSQAVVKILMGQELGIKPMAAMSGISIVKGKPMIGYQLIGTLIDRHPRYNFKVITRNDQKCEIQFFKDGEPSGPPMCYTIEDAKRGGSQNLDKYPATMLFARCLSQGARTYCPDIYGGASVYVEGEIVHDDEKPANTGKGVSAILEQAKAHIDDVQDADFSEDQGDLEI